MPWHVTGVPSQVMLQIKLKSEEGKRSKPGPRTCCLMVQQLSNAFLHNWTNRFAPEHKTPFHSGAAGHFHKLRGVSSRPSLLSGSCTSRSRLELPNSPISICGCRVFLPQVVFPCIQLCGFPADLIEQMSYRNILSKNFASQSFPH